MDISQIEKQVLAYCAHAGDQQKTQLMLFNALWGIMARVSAQVDVSGLALNAESLREDLQEGLPFMSNCPIEVDAESLADAVDVLSSCLVDSGVYQPEICTAIKAVNMRQLIVLSDMELAAVDPEQYLNSLVQVMQNYGLDGSQITVLVGLVSYALRALQEPAAQAMVAAVPRKDFASAHVLSCPVCGGRPALAVLVRQKPRKGTGRKLACIQCGTEWEFDRIRCPHCGTTDVRHLGYRTIKGDGAHRIDYCDKCGNYIRTAVVETATTEYSLDVEDCVMAAMDAYADEGDQQNTR